MVTLTEDLLKFKQIVENDSNSNQYQTSGTKRKTGLDELEENIIHALLNAAINRTTTRLEQEATVIVKKEFAKYKSNFA